jgi:hypothetical protein
MRTVGVLGLSVLMYACASGSGPAQRSSASPAPATGDSTRPRARIEFRDPFSPDVGPAAVKAFIPDVAAFESGGECAMHKLPGSSSATITTAYFPSRAAPQMTVSITFDSAGHLVQYAELRGVVTLRGFPPGTSAPQRDSALRAAEAAMRSTSISLNYPIDQGILRNRGGGKPSNAALSSVHEIEAVARFGPVTERLVRVRKLCGV